MLTMLQRQLGAPANGLNRQASSEMLASPGALSRGVSRNNSFSRRAPAGGLGSIPQSRSRSSLLVACSGLYGSFGDGSASDANSPSEFFQPMGQGEAMGQPQQPQQQQPRGGSSSMRAPDAAAPPSSPSASAQPLRPRNEQAWDFGSEPFVPSPANLPTNEDNAPLLYPPRPVRPLHKDLWTLTDQPGVDLFLAGPLAWSRLRQVYVILFGVGERETEGIYSLRAYGSDRIPHETIIAFECEEEAQRYAGLLEASMAHLPHVCSISPRELLMFCLDQTYSCRLEPKDSLLIPPDFNVSITDWERSLRLRDGKFAVLDSEPELFGAAGAGGTTATATVTATTTTTAPLAGQPGSNNNNNLQAGGPGGNHPSTLARYSGLSGSELEEIRARLESLLPADE